MPFKRLLFVLFELNRLVNNIVHIILASSSWKLERIPSNIFKHEYAI